MSYDELNKIGIPVVILHPKYRGEFGSITKIYPTGTLCDEKIIEVTFGMGKNKGQFKQNELDLL